MSKFQMKPTLFERVRRVDQGHVIFMKNIGIFKRKSNYNFTNIKISVLSLFAIPSRMHNKFIAHAFLFHSLRSLIWTVVALQQILCAWGIVSFLYLSSICMVYNLSLSCPNPISYLYRCISLLILSLLYLRTHPLMKKFRRIRYLLWNERYFSILIFSCIFSTALNFRFLHLPWLLFLKLVENLI